MKTVYVILLLIFSFNAFAIPTPNTGTGFSWELPTTYDDGSPAPLSDISAYKFYWKINATDQYTDTNSLTITPNDVQSVLFSIFPNLPNGTYIGTMTTVDINGNEGDYNPEEVSFTVVGGKLLKFKKILPPGQIKKY